MAQAALSTWRTRAASAPTAKRKLGAQNRKGPNPKRQPLPRSAAIPSPHPTHRRHPLPLDLLV